MNSDRFISAKTVGEAWIKCLETILQRGSWIRDDSERLLEMSSVFMRIRHIDEADPLLVKYADKERIQVMKVKYSFCGVLPQYKISYGKLLYDNNGVDQIQWVIRRLKAKRETKSATITFHHPGELILSCLSMLDFKIRNEELQMTAVYRSQNAFASQPGNLVALNEVHNKVASALACEVGSVELLVASAHIYECDLDAAKHVVAAAHQNGVKDAPPTPVRAHLRKEPALPQS